MSISAYRRRQEMAEKPRELERRAFSIVTGKLAGAKDKGGPQLIDACYLNYQLWSTLQGDLALPDNALPVELKARLLSLSIWENEEAVATWRNTADHRGAQALGRNSVFADYRLRVAHVLRDYGMGERAQVPADSREYHQR